MRHPLRIVEDSASASATAADVVTDKVSRAVTNILSAVPSYLHTISLDIRLSLSSKHAANDVRTSHPYIARAPLNDVDDLTVSLWPDRGQERWVYKHNVPRPSMDKGSTDAGQAISPADNSANTAQSLTVTSYGSVIDADHPSGVLVHLWPASDDLEARCLDDVEYVLAAETFTRGSRLRPGYSFELATSYLPQGGLTVVARARPAYSLSESVLETLEKAAKRARPKS